MSIPSMWRVVVCGLSMLALGRAEADMVNLALNKPVTALTELRTMLEDEGDLAVRAYARRIGARLVASDFVPPNVNNAADLDRLRGL